MYIESKYQFALYNGTHECARTNMLLLLIAEVCTAKVSLIMFDREGRTGGDLKCTTTISICKIPL